MFYFGAAGTLLSAASRITEFEFADKTGAEETIEELAALFAGFATAIFDIIEFETVALFVNKIRRHRIAFGTHSFARLFFISLRYFRVFRIIRALQNHVNGNARKKQNQRAQRKPDSETRKFSIPRNDGAATKCFSSA